MKTYSLFIALCFLSFITFGKTYTLKIDGGGAGGYHTVTYKDDSTKTTICCDGTGTNPRPKVVANDGPRAASTAFVNTQFEAALDKVKQGKLTGTMNITDDVTRRMFTVTWKAKDATHVTICVAPEEKKKTM